MFIYFQAIYLERWGADPIQIGAVLGAMGVAMTVAQAPAGYLADRVGSRPVMWSSWVLGSLAALIMALAHSLTGFVAGLLIYGLTSFVVAPMNSYITSVRGRLSVERALTFVSAMFHLGAVLGPLVGGIIGEDYGLPVVYRFSAGIFILSTVVVFSVRRPPKETDQEAQIESMAARTNLLRNPRFLGLLAVILITMFALYLPYPFSANYLEDVHAFSLRDIGLLGSLGSLGNAVLMLALGFLNAPVGFVVGQALVGLFALLMWQGDRMLWFGLGFFFFGGYRLSRSMALAYTRSIVQASETGFAFGLVETGNAIATILAPPVAGLLYQHDPQSIYIASLVAVGAVLTINLMLLPGKRKSKEVAQGTFPGAAQTERTSVQDG